LALTAPPPAQDPPNTHPLPARWMWDPGCQEQVFARFSDPQTQAAIQAALQLLPTDLQLAYDHLADIFVTCAREGGLKARKPSARSSLRRGGPVRKPWFDAECQEARKNLRRARHDNTPHVAILEHVFHRACRAKKRAYKKASALEYARMVKSNPNRLWHALRPPTHTPTTCPADPHQCRPYFQSAFNPQSTSDPTQQQAPHLGDPTAEPDHPLNGDITTDEVLTALKQLKNSKSPGIDGLPPELLKYACPRRDQSPIFSMNPLLEPLATLFTHLLSNGTAPDSWAATLVTLIFKKGDPTQWSNYRPVAMVPLLAKLYTIILNNRLVAWAEAAGVRVPAQTGFRPRHATTHHAFVLQHLIEKYKKRRQKHLFCCFVDLAKAYDSVPRDLLWQRLHDVGVRGRMLHAIKGLYDVGVDMHIKTAEGTLDPVRTSVGVKQGCPLSPTLFGLYIDGLQHHVASACPHAGPTLHSAPEVRLSLLIYADDTAILANSAEELQQLLTCVDGWCGSHGMTISTVKSEATVFNCKQPAQSVNVSVQGKPIPVCKVFKYLGVWFHHIKGAAFNVQKAASRGKFAIACLHRKLYDLDVGSNVRLAFKLYDSLVMPAMLYGCEVWGSCMLGSRSPAESVVLPEQVHRNFIKFNLKMRHNTKSWVAFREAGMYPLQYSCLHRMLAFLDSVLALDDGEYVKIAMLDCIRDARDVGVDNWFSKLSNLLTHVHGGTVPVDALLTDGSVNVDKCLTLWRKHQHTAIWGNLSADPRTAPRDNVTLCTYHAWFAEPIDDERHQHWRPASCIRATNIPYSQLISLIKLRTNSHHLDIERLRHVRPRVPRSRRACPWCRTPDALHDELHCTLECPHLSNTRLRYPTLFGAGQVGADMRTLFTAEHLAAPMASFVHSFPAKTDEQPGTAIT
jgi:Reverse transcriptase (RNA-dependent DNA polymerase)